MNRPLSILEYSGWLIDQAVSLNFVMAARMSGLLQVLGDSKQSLLRRALDLVQQKHPPLRCRFKDGDAPGYVSEGVPGIPLRIIQRKDDNHWLEVAEKEMLEPMPWKTGPLVRVVLLESPDKCDLLASFCHITTDATSGVTFVKNLLSIVEQLSRGENPVLGSPLPQLPPVLDLLKKDLKYPPEFFDIPGGIRRILHKKVELKGDMEVSPVKRITRIIQRTLSPADTKRLIKRCKKEKASVHAALCAPFLQTIVEQVRMKQNVRQKGPLMIECLTPVDIRHLFDEPVGENMGNFISNSLHSQLIDDRSSPWTAARKIKKAIGKTLKYGKDIKAIRNAGKSFNPNVSPLETAINLNNSYPPVAVTNMGIVDIPEQFGNISLEKFHFTVSINPATKNGFAMAVTSFRRGITINFLYAEPYLSRKTADIIVESTMKRLKAAIEE